MKRTSLIAMLLAATAASSQEGHDHSGHGAAPAKLGTVHFATSCAASAAPDLQRGVALVHHMTYESAEEAFLAAAQKDPQCGMAYWGVAMTLFHPVWPGQPDAATLARGQAMLDKARGFTRTEREKDYVEAAAAYYRDSAQLDHNVRLRNFSDAMEKLYRKYYPADIEAAAFYALSLLGIIDPSDRTYARQKQAGTLVEEIAAREPDHPGVYHYIIHAYDYPGLAERALSAARKYDKVAPENPHALHMPTHIFTRLGLWKESIAWNLRSATAAKKLNPGGAVSIHYAHALDYLEYAYLQGAKDARADQVLRDLGSVATWQDDFPAAYALAAVPVRRAVEHHRWAEAAELKPRQPASFPWDKYAAPEAIVHFGRALGAARSGDLSKAKAEVASLDGLLEKLKQAKNAYWATQVDIQRQAAQAWLTLAEGRKEEAVKQMRSAADLESTTEKHPVTPGEVLPARELIGDLLVEVGRPADALTEYEQALKRSPNRFNSLYGAGRAAEAARNPAAARTYYAKLVEVCADGEAGRGELRHAKAFLAKGAIQGRQTKPGQQRREEVGSR